MEPSVLLQIGSVSTDGPQQLVVECKRGSVLRLFLESEVMRCPHGDVSPAALQFSCARQKILEILEDVFLHFTP